MIVGEGMMVGAFVVIAVNTMMALFSVSGECIIDLCIGSAILHVVYNR